MCLTGGVNCSCWLLCVLTHALSVGFWFFFVALSCWSYSPDCDCRQDVGQEHGRSGRRRLPRIVLFQVGRLKLEKAILSQAKLIATDLVEL